MPEPEHHVEKKVVYETTSATTSGNSIAAWVIIGILAIALIAYILVKIT
jgi:hypothetical protein